MIELGKVNALEVLREASVGLYLGDGEGHEVLLPWKYVPGKCAAGSMLDVFIYHDGEERLIATTLEPKIHLYEFANLQAAAITSFGAFMDMGLENDLLLPWREMAFPLKQGQRAVVFMYMDERSGRLAGSTRVGKFLSHDKPELREGDKVTALIYEESNLGFKAIVNQKFNGLIYHNEIFRTVHLGETLDAWVKAVRSDNKIDLMLQEPGYAAIDAESKRLLEKLSANEGFLPLHDGSTPEEISRMLGMSKKTFKKCVGAMLRKRLISLEEGGIRLTIQSS